MPANSIRKVHIRNFRNLADVTVDLSAITVLVGRNGAGKSNFIDALRFVSEALLLGLDGALTKRGGIGRVRRWSAKGRPYDVSFTLTLTLDGQDAEYSFSLGSDRVNEYTIKHEQFTWANEPVYAREASKWTTPPGDSTSNSLSEQTLVLPLVSERTVYEHLTRISTYTIFPNALREPQRSLTPYPLNEHGDNLASALREFRNSPWFDDLKVSLGHIITGVTDVDVRQVGTYLVPRLKHETGSWFDLAQESDGTLRVLGLLLAVYQHPPRSLLALEEPELTIHAGALGVLCDVIREASERSQIVITTHSPDLISRFAIDELRLVEHTRDGSRIDAVDDDQKQLIQDQLFSSGDLLRIEGLRRTAE